MKKILSGAVAVAVLSTNALSFYIKDASFVFYLEKNQFCENIDKERIRLEDGLCKINKKDKSQYSISLNAIKEAHNQQFNAKYGALTTKFLEQRGVGIEKNMDWGSIAVSYEEFLCSLTKKERDELFIFLSQTAFVKTDENKEISKAYISFATIEVFNNYDLQGKEAFLDSYFLLGFFANNKFQAKYFNDFFKFLIMKDYDRAIKYVIDKNKEVGYSEIMEEIKKECKTNVKLFDSYIKISSKGRGAELINYNP